MVLWGLVGEGRGGINENGPNQFYHGLRSRSVRRNKHLMMNVRTTKG